MKRLLVTLFVFATLSTLTLAQSESEHFGQRTSRFPASCTAGTGSYLNASCTAVASPITLNLNNWWTTGSDVCTAINTALGTVAAGSAVTLDARGVTGTSVSCGSNPFLNSSTSTTFNVQGQLLLGNVIIDTTATWTIPTRFWVRGIGLSGETTNDGNSQQNTIIKATTWGTSSCPAGLSLDLNGASTSDCPVLFIGAAEAAGTSNSTDVFAAGFSNLTVDCAGSSTCIGAASVEVQEGGGIDTVSLINQMVTCVDFDGSTKGAGTAGLSNSFLRNINCTLPNAANGAVPFNGIVLYAIDGMAEISNTSVTIPGAGTNGSTISGSCMLINAAYGLTVNYLHCEHATNAITIGPVTNNTTNPTTGVSLTGLTTGNMVNSSANSAVLIQNASEVTVRGLALSPTTSSVKSINDKVNNVTIADALVGFYSESTAGGVLVSASSTTPWVLPATSFTGLTTGNYGTAPVGAVAVCTGCNTGASCASGSSVALAVKTTTSSTGWVCK